MDTDTPAAKASAMYAVVDLETTGLFTRDRVIEIAIVHVDARGVVTDEWDTLVNPDRDLGPVSVHGIRARDVREAPPFDRIAAEVTRRLGGRIPVAHNLVFDARLLTAEFDRLGVAIPALLEFGVCTADWAAQFLPGRRSLADCCRAAGVANDSPHQALSDALATAGLLRHYILDDWPPPWSGLELTAKAARWPWLPGGSPSARRRDADPGFVSRLPAVSSRTPLEADLVEYLCLLDVALLDEYVSAAEADRLVALAEERGIDRPRAERLHRAWIAGVNDPGTANRLCRVLSLADAGTAATGLGHAPFALAPGDIVVLTGEFPESKQYWTARLTKAGMRVASYVSKSTRLVVAADPDSLSTKAKRARHLGIPVTGSAALQRLLHT